MVNGLGSGINPYSCMGGQCPMSGQAAPSQSAPPPPQAGTQGSSPMDMGVRSKKIDNYDQAVKQTMTKNPGAALNKDKDMIKGASPKKFDQIKNQRKQDKKDSGMALGQGMRNASKQDPKMKSYLQAMEKKSECQQQADKAQGKNPMKKSDYMAGNLESDPVIKSQRPELSAGATDYLENKTLSQNTERAQAERGGGMQ